MQEYNLLRQKMDQQDKVLFWKYSSPEEGF